MNNARTASGCAGFTLTEVVFAVGIFVLVSTALIGVYISCNRVWYRTDVNMRAMRQANFPLQKMVYGLGPADGLLSAVGTNVSVVSSGTFWQVWYSTIDGNRYRFYYDRPAGTISSTDSATSNTTIIGRDIVDSAITLSTNRGISIRVTAGVLDGRFSATNAVATYVKFRN